MKKYILGALLVIGFIVLVSLSPFTVVDAGHRAVVTHFGEVQDEILGEGFHFISPLADTTEINVRTQTISFEKDTKGALASASKDLQDVNISFVANYHPDPELVNKIYQEYGLSYEENILAPIVRETVKLVSAQYTAEELVTKRAEVSSAIESLLMVSFSERMMILESASVVNFQYSDSFSASIEKKVTAEQDALAAKNKLEQIKYEAEQTVVSAQAEAEAIRIQAEAITQQGGEAYVDLQAVNRWNGVLPSYVLGDSVPFIGL